MVWRNRPPSQLAFAPVQQTVMGIDKNGRCPIPSLIGPGPFPGFRQGFDQTAANSLDLVLQILNASAVRVHDEAQSQAGQSW